METANTHRGGGFVNQGALQRTVRAIQTSQGKQRAASSAGGACSGSSAYPKPRSRALCTHNRRCNVSVHVWIDTTFFISRLHTTSSRFVIWAFPIESANVRRVAAIERGVRSCHLHRHQRHSARSSSRPPSTPLRHFIIRVVDHWCLKFVFRINNIARPKISVWMKFHWHSAV